jgi:multidrug transporter EmrE-like cation transporter
MFGVLCICCTELCGNFNLKWYSENKELKHLIVALASYALMIFLLIKLFTSQKSMLRVNALWQALTVIIGTIASYLILGDKITHPVQYLGLVFALLAIICINYG